MTRLLTLILLLGTGCNEATPQATGEGTLRINEVSPAPSEGADWIELFNAGSKAVELSDYSLVDDNPDHATETLKSGSLAPGAFAVVEAKSATDGALTFGLGKTDALTLRRGETVIDALSWTASDFEPGASFGRRSEGETDTAMLSPTPGAANILWGQGHADQQAFPQDRVITVRIGLSEDALMRMLNDPRAEQYVEGSIDYDGTVLDSVAVRFKGNSSLNSVQRMGSDRYSFKVDFNRFVPGQRLRGMKKLNFNNGFKDPSLLREKLAYEAYASLGLPTPRTTFVDLYAAGAHMGLYLAVEQVDDDFLDRHFGRSDGHLYKPEGGAGSLQYRGDALRDYGGDFGLKEGDDNHSALFAMMRALEPGSTADLSAHLAIDPVAAYLAATVALVNLDSYLGMGHNFYLYELDGVFSVIPWDLNEAYGNFRCRCSNDELLALRIDEPTCGSLAGYPLVQRFIGDEARRDRYHQQIQSLLDGPLAETAFNQAVDRWADLIRSTVQADERLFFSVAAFEDAVSQTQLGQGGQQAMPLKAFRQGRSVRLAAQLSNQEPRTADGSGSCEGGPGGGGGGNPCGDGICDRAERDNPNLCPRDCP